MTSRSRALRASSRLGPLVELDAGATRELRERLGEVERVALHHEREDVAVLAAAEAVPGVAGRRDDEADGVFSPWNGHRPLRVVPAFFSWTVSPTTSATGSRPLISATTPTAKGAPSRSAGRQTDRK